MKAIFTILLWLVGVFVFVIFLLVGFFLPKTAHIERIAGIHANPEARYPSLIILPYTINGWFGAQFASTGKFNAFFSYGEQSFCMGIKQPLKILPT